MVTLTDEEYLHIVWGDFWCQVAIVALCKKLFKHSAIEHYDGLTL